MEKFKARSTQVSTRGLANAPVRTQSAAIIGRCHQSLHASPLARVGAQPKFLHRSWRDLTGICGMHMSPTCRFMGSYIWGFEPGGIAIWGFSDKGPLGYVERMRLGESC